MRLEALQAVPKGDQSVQYLDGVQTTIEHMYLYIHTQCVDRFFSSRMLFYRDTRACCALFVNATLKCHVWFVDRIRPTNIPNVQRLYLEMYDER